MAKRSDKDKQMAADLKNRGIERTTGKCAGCGRMITIQSAKSKYTHMCKG